MSHSHRLHSVVLAASVALALSSTVAIAADAPPAAAQLPGQGKITATTAPTVTVNTDTSTMDVVLNANTVINWGSGTDINGAGVAGFNIGADATVNFAGAFGVLNIDATGNPSQIFGTLTSAGNVYVANTNGIIVGATGQLASSVGQVGLIANIRGATTFDGSAVPASIELAGTGGDITIMKGAAISSGSSTYVSGGGLVNLDLGTLKSGGVTLLAGRRNSSSTLVAENANAVLTATGEIAGGVILGTFSSAGDASTSGKLTLGINAGVDGTLTNTGALSLGAGFAIKGGLVNNQTVKQAAHAAMGRLANNGVYDGAGFDLTTTKGGINNAGAMSNIVNVQINGGDFVNNGEFTSNLYFNVFGGGSVVNNGEATVGDYVAIYEGGDFINAGTMVTRGVYVRNGNITNSGQLSVANYLRTASDNSAGLGFTKAADYSITNTGTMTATNGLFALAANSDASRDRGGDDKNDSTGSVNNTGILRVGRAPNLAFNAYNDVNLSGTVQKYDGTRYVALSATHTLGILSVGAADFDGGVLSTDGVATVATDLFAWSAEIQGSQVKLMSNISADDHVEVIAGAKSDADYAVRLAAGKTVSAGNWIHVDGDQAGDESNVILQGTLEANDIRFGSANAVSDVFTGPAGSLSLVDNGAAPTLQFAFTGAVKTVPYNNTPSNFRYNGLNVVTDGSVLRLTLNPVDYLTSGTSTGSAVNILVNGDGVALTGLSTAPVLAGDVAVTGVTNIPSTHLVLQSSGNISATGNFYWPGYVYLGTVAADADGNALPGTLGFGTITTAGDFNNVLPGDVSGASGIHFITQFPMTLGGDVVTNGNAWVNFGTDLLTQGYANGTLGGSFFGGVNTVGTVVSYGELDPSAFHTHAPTAAK